MENRGDFGDAQLALLAPAEEAVMAEVKAEERAEGAFERIVLTEGSVWLSLFCFCHVAVLTRIALNLLEPHLHSSITRDIGYGFFLPGLLGALLMGVLSRYHRVRQEHHIHDGFFYQTFYIGLTSGFCGTLTTFSTWNFRIAMHSVNGDSRARAQFSLRRSVHTHFLAQPLPMDCGQYSCLSLPHCPLPCLAITLPLCPSSPRHGQKLCSRRPRPMRGRTIMTSHLFTDWPASLKRMLAPRKMVIGGTMRCLYGPLSVLSCCTTLPIPSGYCLPFSRTATSIGCSDASSVSSSSLHLP